MKARDIPKEFAVAKQRYATAIAACVMLEPATAPSSSELSRIAIHEEQLRVLLSMVPLSMGSSERMVELAWKHCERAWVLSVVNSATFHHGRSSAFVWLSRWYVAKLCECYEMEKKYVDDCVRMIETRKQLQRVEF